MSNNAPGSITSMSGEDWKFNPILPTLEVFKLDKRAALPVKQHESDAAWDISAFILTETGRPSKKMLSQKNTVMVPTGLVLKPPPGFFIQVCSRSGLALRGVFVANAPGIVDPDYSGELMILLYNGSYETEWIEHGHRIAQIILTPLQNAAIRETSELPIPSGRGPAGLGSTGV